MVVEIKIEGVDSLSSADRAGIPDLLESRSISRADLEILSGFAECEESYFKLPQQLKISFYVPRIWERGYKGKGMVRNWALASMSKAGILEIRFILSPIWLGHQPVRRLSISAHSRLCSQAVR